MVACRKPYLTGILETFKGSSPVSATLSGNVGSLVVERLTHFFLALDHANVLITFDYFSTRYKLFSKFVPSCFVEHLSRFRLWFVSQKYSFSM